VSDLFDLTGRVALLTGATGRLGTVFAAGLAAAGAELILTGRDTERLDELQRTIGGQVVQTAVADLRDEGEIDGVFEAIRKEIDRLDILVNNAGTGRDAPFGKVSAGDMRAIQELNVAAPVLCAQHAAGLMMPQGRGKIVNIGSIYGTVAVDTRLYAKASGMVQGSPAYVASKAALVNLTRELAVRLAPMNIQVNLLSPGGVQADQPMAFQEAYVTRTPAGRMAAAEDLVGTLIFLCSTASDYVTGQNVLVDGGFTAW
jgi:NAD(P)-dependent dehydrogenase (short-subunit alcohol dehydrogenase family)